MRKNTFRQRFSFSKTDKDNIKTPENSSEKTSFEHTQQMNAESEENSDRQPTAGEKALFKYIEVWEQVRSQFSTETIRKCAFDESQIDPYLFRNLGWPLPITVSVEPTPHTVPPKLLEYEPEEDQKHNHYFVGTSKEVALRQIFSHSKLDIAEEESILKVRYYCQKNGFEIPPLMEPSLLRVISYNKRRYPHDYLAKTLDHLQHMSEWRLKTFPIRDSQSQLQEDLQTGTMYWSCRDAYFRPLLIINLSRFPKSEQIVQRFKTLAVFCMEWALRFLMIPGKVETCAVLLDIRSVTLHQLPISALSEIVALFTKQYPFRLNKMWIIHDSLFIQMLWNAAKGFLTEVQQQKMAFFRHGFREVLQQEYGIPQLEQHYGGSHQTHKTFYPFPLANGSIKSVTVPATAKMTNKVFRHTSKQLLKSLSLSSTEKKLHCHTISESEQDFDGNLEAWRCIDELTCFGISWEGSCRLPILWSTEALAIFKQLKPSQNVIKSWRDVLKEDPLANYYGTLFKENMPTISNERNTSNDIIEMPDDEKRTLEHTCTPIYSSSASIDQNIDRIIQIESPTDKHDLCSEQVYCTDSKFETEQKQEYTSKIILEHSAEEETMKEPNATEKLGDVEENVAKIEMVPRLTSKRHRFFKQSLHTKMWCICFSP
ncbi:CRAL/TRIO domain-containing protein [Cardiosporidium cionae]|uniref:CRAL/TRIO domain-containing protein n=1 Tax=Cardiosporidium cionae TaxID=476202 RepID=A0ABQ7JG06_9APIC|nr:CRAL/TRIO domain-containing protein [Cardiosporidium cionae]|eukprot:KAF8822962.1 CRAL/TRIO domain-containing protein [Cardiosporidium cionae]